MRRWYGWMGEVLEEMGRTLLPTPLISTILAAKAIERFGNFCVLTTSAVQRPSGLMVFASARGPFEGRIVNGFHTIKPPYLMARRWAVSWNPDDGPEAWGDVHPRFNDRAISGMTDGHSEMLDRRALQDMQHWSNQADRPDWVLTRIP